MISRYNSMGVVLIFILLTLCSDLINGKPSYNHHRLKKSASSDDNLLMDHTDSRDRLNINYDEYPMIVPKRAAILLDRIMVALHHALEDDDAEGIRRISDVYKDKTTLPPKHLHLLSNPDKFVPNFSIDGDDGINEDTPTYLEARGLNTNNNLDDMTGLQRRGHGDTSSFNKGGRVYWRCYFNAVTCF